MVGLWRNSAGTVLRRSSRYLIDTSSSSKGGAINCDADNAGSQGERIGSWLLGKLHGHRTGLGKAKHGR